MKLKLYIITGLIGSGKTTVSKLFQKKGFKYINADNVVKEILQSDKRVKNKLITKFDNSILNNNKSISFILLRNKLIKSKKNKDYIEKIIHKEFYARINVFLKNTKVKKIILEIPLLETCKKIKKSYKVIMIDSKTKLRELRRAEKSNNSIGIFKKLNKLQKTRKFYKNNSNYIITNNGTMKQLRKEFKDFYRSNIIEN